MKPQYNTSRRRPTAVIVQSICPKVLAGAWVCVFFFFFFFFFCIFFFFFFFFFFHLSWYAQVGSDCWTVLYIHMEGAHSVHFTAPRDHPAPPLRPLDSDGTIAARGAHSEIGAWDRVCRAERQNGLAEAKRGEVTSD
jgi:hypothetical protein